MYNDCTRRGCGRGAPPTGDRMTDAEGVRQSLIAVLGREAVITDSAEREYFARDALGPQRALHRPDGAALPGAGPPVPPLAVVRPRSTEEVAAVVRLANRHRVPVVPYGGGSGLMGGARSLEPGIVIDMGRLNRVLEIDAAAGWAWVQAGAVLKDVDRALNAHGLILGHDPWTVPVATIGGTISTNGLGYRGGKYGSMGDQVLAVEAVMPDGTVIRTRPPWPRSTGINLKFLFVDGEGEYGIVTAAAIRAFPMPELRVLRGYRFASFEAGFHATLRMYGIGLVPALMDYGERSAPPFAAARPGARWQDEPPSLYLGFEGFREEVEAQAGRAAAICREFGAEPIEQEEVEEFWETRHVPAERFASTRASRRALPEQPDDEPSRFDYVHVALPASRVLEYRERALALAREHRVHVLENGTWVWPGLFSMVMVNAEATPEEAARRMAAAVDGCLRLAHHLGGAMEYCHGVGIRLAHLMEEEHGAGLTVMRLIKRALDPNGVLNPGKMALTDHAVQG